MTEHEMLRRIQELETENKRLREAEPLKAKGDDENA